MTVLCEVCKQTTSKYKCSNCFCPYCSVSCWRQHKNEDNCKAQKRLEETSKTQDIGRTFYFSEDTVSDEQLKKLGESESLKKIIGNKHLQNTLLAVDKASNPEETLVQAMKDPEFVSFVDECLKIVEDSNN